MTNEETTTTSEAPNTAEQGTTVAPETAATNKGASPKKDAPKGRKAANGAEEHATPFDQPEPTVSTKSAKKPAKPKAVKKTASVKKAAKATTPKAKAGKPAKSRKKESKPEKGPRAETKGAKLLAMIARPKGATLAELMKELGWQAHSVRGFISIIAKKGTTIESSKNDAGERVYKSTK